MADGIALRFDAYVNPDPRAGTPVYTAADERQLSTILAGPGGALLARAGVRPGPGGAVTVGGTPEAVTVQPFSGIITDPGGGGSYLFVIPAAVSKTLATRPGAGSSRIDELVVKILNDGPRPADGSREVALQLIAGTAGSSPSAPSIPAGQLRIRELAVPASGSVALSKPPARISALGGVVPIADQAEEDALVALAVYDGMIIYREDTDVFKGRVNGAWSTFRTGDTDWSDITLKSGFTSAGGTATPRKRTLGGNDVRLKGRVNGTFAAGATTTIIAAGGVPSPPGTVVMPISGVGAAQSIGLRGIVNTDGSVDISAGTTAPTGVYLDGLSGYLKD